MEENQMSQNQTPSTPKKPCPFVRFFKTLGRWGKRMFCGGSKEVDQLAVEAIESPFRQTVKSFFEKKLAVVALCLLLAMFLLVFIGPLFIDFDENAIDSTQKNVSPTMSLMSVPSSIRKNLKSISSYSSFSVGVSNDGKLAVWGYTKLSTTGTDVADIPEEVQNANIKFAAAGSDHIVAISDTGRIYCWGLNSLGQYRTATDYVALRDDPDNDLGGNNTDAKMPYYLISEIGGTIDVDNVRSVSCGDQTTAIVMNDGSFYIWGNTKVCTNLTAIRNLNQKVESITFTGNKAVALLEDGTFTAGAKVTTFDKTILNGEIVRTNDLIAGRKIVQIATTSKTLALLLEDGDVVIVGSTFEYAENEVPTLNDGEKITDIAAGRNHYVAITDSGRAIAWGDNSAGQCDVDGSLTTASSAFAGSKQSYIVNSEGKLINKAGLKGYLFGTDKYGRDMFKLVVYGGKMTMTIGAVAVIVSCIIGIVVGCLSGYFGGWVDMLLMRITEIFSAIPFLPFALILSAVLRSSPIGETGRIFVIMMILGVLSWTGLARLVRGQVLSERNKEFVTAAKAMGVKEGKIAFRHILPNIISIILVTLTLDFASCMLTESSLSYLGFGVSFPRPTWGNLLNGCNNATVIENYWWQWVFPALFLGVATICINIIGDALRDVMDPKSNAR
jgi:peptide/nickel transport system permease protein